MPSPVDSRGYDAALFDLEGVLTMTRSMLRAAWARTFGEFLEAWDREHGTATSSFDEASDSSLSECVQAVAAAGAAKYRTAEEHLIDAAAVDLADRAGNLRDGVHVASAAGAWLALGFGLAGHRWRGERPEFHPMLPTRVRR